MTALLKNVKARQSQDFLLEQVFSFVKKVFMTVKCANIELGEKAGLSSENEKLN